MCLSSWTFSSCRTIKAMKGGSEIISVDWREIVFILWKSPGVARFPYNGHDDVKSGWTCRKPSNAAGEMSAHLSASLPHLFILHSLCPSLTLCPSFSSSSPPSLSPAIRVRSWTTLTVIYRPGFPRELLAPLGICAVRQNPMHVYSQFIRKSTNLNIIFVIQTKLDTKRW